MIGKTKIVGEIGIAHQGDRNEALRIIKEFEPYVDFFKVQIRTPEICVPKHMWKEKRFVRGESISYIDYKKQMELDWDVVFKEANVPSWRWFASVWDVPALKRYLKMNSVSKKVKFPACFSFKPNMYLDLLTIIPDDWDVFLSMPVVENPQSCLYYKKLKVSTKKNVTPFLTFMTYNKPAYNESMIEDFFKHYASDLCGYSSHFDSLDDILVALKKGYEYIEIHLQGKYETSDSKVSRSVDDLKKFYELGKKCNYSYVEIDWEKIKSLIPEKWK